MKYDIEQDLAALESLKEQYNTVNSQIEIKRAEFEKSINQSIYLLENIREKRQTLSNREVPVRFGDLLRYIAVNSGHSINDIEIDIHTDLYVQGKVNASYFESVMKSYDDSRYSVYFHIKSKKINENNNPEFLYDFTFNFEPESIQFDGKTLSSHTSISKEYSPFYNDYIMRLVIDKNIKDLIVNIPLRLIEDIDNDYFYPNNLFKKSLIDCCKNGEVLKTKPEKSITRVRTSRK